MRGSIACVVSVAVCVSALVASTAPAAEWSGSATLFLREEYNDNILMTTAPHDTVWGSTASSLLTLAMRDERLQVKAAALTEYTRYAGQQGLDTTIYDLTLSPVYTTGRATWGLDGELKQDLTLGGELQETGVVLTRSRRRTGSVGPSLTWALTEKTSLQWQYRLTHVLYPGGDPGLVNYDLQEATMAAIVSATERSSVTVSLDYTEYRATSVSYLSRDYAARIELTHHFTELTTGSLAAGGHQSTSTAGSSGTDRQWGWLFDGHLERQSEVMTVTGRVSHEVYPSGAGYLLEVAHASGQINRNLFLSLSVFASADAYLSTALRTDIHIPDSRYYSTGAGLSWKWNEHWATDASYQYSRQDAPEVVKANVVYLRVVFTGDTVFSSP